MNTIEAALVALEKATDGRALSPSQQIQLGAALATVALAEEMRTMNAAVALRLGSSALDTVVVEKAKSPTTQARQVRANQLRAMVRDGLGVQ